MNNVECKQELGCAFICMCAWKEEQRKRLELVIDDTPDCDGCDDCYPSEESMDKE